MRHDPSRITYLLKSYTSKTCTREELNELFAYLAAAENNEALYDTIEEAYQDIHPGSELPEIDYESVFDNIILQSPARKLFVFRSVAAAAALLFLAVTALWWVGRNKTDTNSTIGTVFTDVSPGTNKATLTLADGSTVTLDSAGNQVISHGSTNITQQNGQLLYAAQKAGAGIQYNKLATPRGGQYRVTLPDGTKVWLNSSSTLKYPTAFTGSQRIVELEGQGYFEVASNAAQPFKVLVNDMEVQVLGTHFDVMAYKDETTVNTTLLEGKVQVKEGANLQLLKPGQQALRNNQNHTISVQEADVKKVMAWKNGLFVFNNMALPAILREIARWYDVDIIYQTLPSTELYGGGIGRNLHLSNVLSLLETSGYNHFKLDGRKVIVLP
jgi:transmembrane sensor